MIRVFDAFSGIGGFRSAFERVGGFEMIGWCEIDKFAQKSYRAMFDTGSEEFYENIRDRGITIPPTRNPGLIHHANLGSMEGNVFTIIGNRMKGRRACWSIKGGNRLAALLCKHYSVKVTSTQDIVERTANIAPPLSATKVPKKEGKGYEFNRNISISSSLKWLKQISICKPLTEFSF